MAVSYTEDMGIEFVEATPQRAEGIMAIDPRFHQPYGFVHGGVTLTLLESVASKGAEAHADLSRERPFGISIDVRHRKAAREGQLRGVAELDRVEGNKQFWNIAAYDDAGDVVSSGTFMSKVVSLERLRQKGMDIPPMEGEQEGEQLR